MKAKSPADGADEVAASADTFNKFNGHFCHLPKSAATSIAPMSLSRGRQMSAAKEHEGPRVAPAKTCKPLAQQDVPAVRSHGNGCQTSACITSQEVDAAFLKSAHSAARLRQAAVKMFRGLR